MSRVRFVDQTKFNAYKVTNATTATSASYATTASYADFATSASYAVSASHEIIKEVSSSHADTALSASYALTASYAPSPFTAAGISGSWQAQTSSMTVLSASYSITASYALNASDSDFTAAGISGSWQNQTSSMSVLSASYATTASYVLNAVSASYAVSASHEIIKEISSSHADTADTAAGLTGQPSIYVTNITASGDISSSGLLYVSASQGVNGTDNWTLLYNTGSGQVFYTASSAVGGGGTSGPFTQVGSTTTYQATDSKDLQITGSLIISGSFNAFRLDTNNIILGEGAGANIVTGATSNVIIGKGAAGAATMASNMDKNVMIGYHAGYQSVQAANNVMIGHSAGNVNQNGNNNVYVGTLSGENNKGAGNVGLGYGTIRSGGGTPDYNIGIGYLTLYVADDANYNAGIGHSSLRYLDNGNDNIAIGRYSGTNIIDGNRNIVIGLSASLAGDYSDQLFIGSASLATISASLVTGDIIFPSTASAEYFVGDGSQLTGLSSATSLTQSIFVSPSGDDSTAVIGDLHKPFASLTSASVAATTGSVIFVYPGTYTAPAENLAFEGGSYYFHPNTVVSKSAAGPIFKSTNFGVGFNVYGQADFYLTSSCEEVIEAGASSNPTPSYTFECQDITQLCGGDYAIQSVVDNNGSTTDIAVANIKFRKLKTDGGGISLPGPYTTEKGSYVINCHEIYAQDSAIYSYQGITYLQVNANRVIGIDDYGYRCYYGTQNELNINYLYGGTYGLSVTGTPKVTLNGFANSIENGSGTIIHNGHCQNLVTAGGTYIGNSVEEGNWSAGNNSILWNTSYPDSGTDNITVSGGVHKIELGESNNYTSILAVSDGKVFIDGYYEGINSNHEFTISGGELIYNAHINWATNVNGKWYPIILSGGTLRMRGYIKNRLNDADTATQHGTCIYYTSGTLILDGATLITSASLAPPVRVIGSDQVAKIYSGGVNTNKTGSMGLLAASSSFGSGGYALTNPLGGMIIEDSSIE